MAQETCVRQAAQLHGNAVDGLRKKMVRAVVDEATQHPKRVRAGYDRLVVTIPRGASSLFRSRPRKPSGKRGVGRRDFHVGCIALLELYGRVAGPPDDRGWRMVSGYTHEYFAQALDYTPRRLQQFHNMLCAMGLVENDGEDDCGDKPGAWTDNKGRPRSVPRRRRRFWLKPAKQSELHATVLQLVRGGSNPTPPAAPSSSEISRSGNQFPTDIQEVLTRDREVSGDLNVPEYPQSLANASRAFNLCAFTDRKPLKLDTSMGISGSTGAARAAPVDPPSSTSQPSSTPTRNASSDRPSAGHRGELSASSGPAEDGFSVGDGVDSPSVVVSPGAELASPAADQVRQLVAQALAAVAAAGASPSPSQPVAVAPGSPAVASPPLGWPGGGPPRASRPSDGQPIPFAAVPHPAAGHKASCDCRPCWISRAVRTGGIPLPPHGRGIECDCVPCLAWRRFRDDEYDRFVKMAKRAPTVQWAKNRRAAAAAAADSYEAAPPPTSTAAVPAAPPSPVSVSPIRSAARPPAPVDSPLYPDNLSPDDVAYGRVHVELLIASREAPAPVPDERGEMPFKVRAYWRKLKAARRKSWATAYMTMFTEAQQLAKLRTLRPDAPPDATYRQLVELERDDRERSRRRRHRVDCKGCFDCQHDHYADVLGAEAHEPLCRAGLCPDCDLAFELVFPRGG